MWPKITLSEEAAVLMKTLKEDCSDLEIWQVAGVLADLLEERPDLAACEREGDLVHLVAFLRDVFENPPQLDGEGRHISITQRGY